MNIYLSFQITFTCTPILKGQDNWQSEVAIFTCFDNFLNVFFIFFTRCASQYGWWMWTSQSLSKRWHLHLLICRDANSTVLKMIVMFTCINSTASQYDMHYIEYLSFKIAFTYSKGKIIGRQRWPYLQVLIIFLMCLFSYFLQGVRASTVDACEHHNPCQNGGICISTDGGPICECSYIDFDGSYCEQSKSNYISSAA